MKKDKPDINIKKEKEIIKKAIEEAEELLRLLDSALYQYDKKKENKNDKQL